MEEIQAACQASSDFVAELETTPDDPNCNLHVGKYQSFVRGDCPGTGPVAAGRALAAGAEVGDAAGCHSLAGRRQRRE